MDDVEEMPRSLPCSAPEAKVGLPTIVQLDFVNEGLERNPEPRNDFYRQYSPTPVRPGSLTPEPPPFNLEDKVRRNKDFAATVAGELKKFYAGRVLLRKEEAEEHVSLEQEQNPNYWWSKVGRWKDLGWDCHLEYCKRREMERKGEAEEGYANALFLSPAQSLSPATTDRVPLEATQQSKPVAAVSSESPDMNLHPSQPLARASQEPLESTSGYTLDGLPKGWKRKDIQTEEEKQKDPEWIKYYRITEELRRRRETLQQQEKQKLKLKHQQKQKPKPKPKPIPEIKSSQGMGQTMPQLYTLPKSRKRKHKEAEDQEQKSSEHTYLVKRQRRNKATTQQKQEPVPDIKSTQGMGQTMPQLHTLPKGRKRKHSEAEDQEQSLESTRLIKRQRKIIATTQQNQDPIPDIKSTQGMGWTMPQLRSTKAQGRIRRKVLSPVPPPSDTSGMNTQNHISIRPRKPPSEKILSNSYRKNSGLHQPKTGSSSDNSTSNVTRRRKLPHTLREDKKRISNKANPRKRQRTSMPNPLPKNKLRSLPASGETPGSKNANLAKARTVGAGRPKELRDSRVLPWVLRPRDPISYCEVGTRAAREGKK